MSTFQIFPNFGRGGGVIENQIFPKFKIVHIILGGVGSRKLWTFSTICDISFLDCSPYECNFIFISRTRLGSKVFSLKSGEVLDFN